MRQCRSGCVRPPPTPGASAWMAGWAPPPACRAWRRTCWRRWLRSWRRRPAAASAPRSAGGSGAGCSGWEPADASWAVPQGCLQGCSLGSNCTAPHLDGQLNGRPHAVGALGALCQRQPPVLPRAAVGARGAFQQRRHGAAHLGRQDGCGRGRAGQRTLRRSWDASRGHFRWCMVALPRQPAMTAGRRQLRGCEAAKRHARPKGSGQWSRPASRVMVYTPGGTVGGV